MNASELLARLPPLERATRRRAAEAVAERLAEGRTPAEIVDGALAERDRLRTLLEAGGEPATVHALVTRTLPDRRTRRALASGRLGREALAERAARDIARREAEALVAFLADPDPRAALRLAGDGCWRLARVGFGALAAARSGSALPVAHERAGGGAPVWTQVAALEYLAAVLGPEASALLQARLGPSADPDDLFVRPAAARALASVDPAAARRLLPALLRDNPSEHVRLELCPLLAALGEAAALREAAAQPSPRVRACAAIALATVDPEALAPILAGDPDELPRRVALEEAEALAPAHPILTRVIEGLASGRIAGPLPVARLAAEAAERLHHQRDRLGRVSLAAAQQASQEMIEGQTREVQCSVPPATMGRALAVLATGDLGLEARETREGFSIRRGDRMRRRLWRLLHELFHPAPEKRQGRLHTVGRAPGGELRAPPGGLAEVTATRVPGERVLIPALGDWGRHLPTVDDLLARPRGGQPAFVFSSFGVTRIDFPRARLRARAALTLRYADYAELRLRSLAADEPVAQGHFAEAVRRLGFRLTFTPYRGAAPAEILEVFRGAGPVGEPRRPSALAVGLAVPPLGELMRDALDPATTGPSHLAALTAAALGLFVVAQSEARRRIERARAAIPLSLGGWGTRGKSGTERLKAALFQGLGCEVLAKTTGCEAMFIHALPGLRAHELFIYRPYDKATIWEQQQVLELAARLGVDVFLWECMALRPRYVEILSRHWMRDDACTITNAYPDHENIQGPAGIDIPRVMTDFIPEGRHLFTAEESMLPVLREAAVTRGTTVSIVRHRDQALLPADLLARFPYQEHPSNVALVLELARRLGVPRDIALKEMADWVVPDLGVLKTYPEASWAGRRLVFSNGMSANERTGFLNNWQRLGFERPVPPGEWVVTLVNNRADRVSRSEVFAGVLVNDASAHAHVLIGTNLSGLRGYIEAALTTRTRALALFHHGEDGLPPARREALALERASRALAGLRLGAVGPGGDPEARPFLEREAARNDLVLRWRRTVGPACASAAGRAACEKAFRALYVELFRGSLIVLPDSRLSGDQVIDAIARACPPGFRVRIMGTQNIKGTGLDFAYRFIAYERTVRLAARLERARGATALALARELAGSEDTGILDGPVAHHAVQAAAAREPALAAELGVAAETIVRRHHERVEALARRRNGGGPLRRAAEALLDVHDGVRRRRRADAIVEELARGEVDHEQAARELRALTQRQKGGWL